MNTKQNLETARVEANRPSHANETGVTWRIESRWPKWSEWKTVAPRPHGEHYPFDNVGLAFPNYNEAKAAAHSFATSNEGEFRIVGGKMILYLFGLKLK